MSGNIEKFLLMNYSQVKLAKMRAPSSGKHDPMQESAVEILKDIVSKEADLVKELEAFTPWESCHISLIRDVLMKHRGKGTKAIAA